MMDANLTNACRQVGDAFVVSRKGHRAEILYSIERVQVVHERVARRLFTGEAEPRIDPRQYVITCEKNVVVFIHEAQMPWGVSGCEHRPDPSPGNRDSTVVVDEDVGLWER